MVILVVMTIICSAIMMCCFWLPHRARRRSARLWVVPVNWLIKHLLGIRYELQGRQNLPSCPSVILCKHQSAWETIVLQEIFPDVLFVWKKELKAIPFFGWALAVLPMISIDRDAGMDALKQMLAQGRMRIGQGYSVVVFPEGTRVAPGQKRRYKVGGACLGVETGAPLIPVALNSGEVWGRNALIKRPGTVIVSIGPAIDARSFGAEEANARAEIWIEDEMRRISPHLYSHEVA